MAGINRRIAILSLAAGGLSAAGGPSVAQQSCVESGEAGAIALVSPARIKKFVPRGRYDLVQALIDGWTLGATSVGITTALRVQHFMAQIATETGGLRTIEENLNYSAQRLLQVFPSRVSREQAYTIEHDAEKIANLVYGGRLGNNQPGDGWLYRGSGFIQLTGRANFERFGISPKAAREPAGGLSAAFKFWDARKINKLADNDDLGAVRKKVNGGTNGLPDARMWLARAKRIFDESVEAGNVANAFTAQEESAVVSLLQQTGLLGVSDVESVTTAERTDATKEFQQKNGLEQTGIVDDATVYALTDPEQFKDIVRYDLSKDSDD